MKKFCRLCDLKLYKPGARIKVSQGGVVLHGSLQLLHDESIIEDKNEGGHDSGFKSYKFGGAGLAAAKKQQTKRANISMLGKKMLMEESNGFNNNRV